MPSDRDGAALLAVASAYWSEIPDGDVAGETFLLAVLGATIGGPVAAVAVPCVNLALHALASLLGGDR